MQTLTDLPNPGKGRFWRVELVKNVQKNPIKITLMEELVEGRRGMASPLAFERTVAVPSKIKEAAEIVLVAAGDYKSVIGDYPLVPTPVEAAA